jgi:hypothetical protein
MVIPVQDWIKDADWRDVHLTSTGWVKGTLRTEKGRFEDEIEPPPDRVLTIRIVESVPSNPEELPKEWSEIIWHTKNQTMLEQAQERWGVLPRSAPPLSSASAAKNPLIPGVPYMRLTDQSRPHGKRRKSW